ncbi:MAG: UDP-N-acetylmuramoyl-L-alanine--D-glutamate ligase, partial [Nocardioidaceae bacterium]
MRSRPPLPEGPYLVVGLARSGQAAARVLRERGEVIGCDSGRPQLGRLDGVELHLESDGVELLGRAAALVKSPGVPRQAPVVAAALERGIPVLGELELAWRLLPNRFIAVTGTNGKTTTVELLGAMLAAAGLPHAVAGNVGTPLASLVGALPRDATVVCETSSFQLEDATAFAPECALLLNLTEDHLDRHGSRAAYAAAKLSIFARQAETDLAVAPAWLALLGPARPVRFGAPDSDLSLREGELRWRGEPLLPAREIRLRGAHNLENAMGAAAAALASGVQAEAVRVALRGFAGVPHRLEEVATADGVLYVNDSKATNVDSAVRGIDAFDGGVHVILGGSLKGGGFRGLRDAVRSRCRACYLIGRAEESLAADLDGAAPLERCGTLERAVAGAPRAAPPRAGGRGSPPRAPGDPSPHNEA